MNTRKATIKDLNRIVEIEKACFPKEEAANRESLKERIQVFPDGFLVAELNGEIIGFVNGAASNRDKISDSMYESMAEHHCDEGEILAIYGVDIHPDYQGHGYSRLMMDAYIQVAKNDKRKKIILTCKRHLVNYYESYGYKSEGVSESNHGGAEWFDMYMNII